MLVSAFDPNQTLAALAFFRATGRYAGSDTPVSQAAGRALAHSYGVGISIGISFD